MGRGQGKGRAGPMDILGFGEGESYGERMSEAFHGAICGVVLFIAAIALLGWNEKRAVYRAKTIDRARDEFVQLDSCKPDPSKNGKLVAITACDPAPLLGTTFTNLNYLEGIGTQTGTGNLPADAKTGNVFSFDRGVENYSYKESEQTRTKNTGRGSTTRKETEYTYNRAWVTSKQTFRGDRASPSVAWPAGYRTQPTIRKTEQVCFGTKGKTCPKGTKDAFVLLSSVPKQNDWIGGVGESEPRMPLSSSVAVTTVGSGSARYCNNYLQTGTCNSPVASEGSTLGDFRWQWSRRVKTPTLVASAIAQQTANADGTIGFAEWQNPDYSDCSYCRIGDFYNSEKTGQEILDELESANTVLTWVLRFVGWFVVWLGCQLCFAPIAAAPTLIPVIGDFIGGILGGVLCCLTCVMGTSIAFLVIAIAWLAYRPMIGVPLLLLCCAGTAGAVFFTMKEKQKRDARKQQYAYADAPAGVPPSSNPYQQMAPAGEMGYPPPGNVSPGGSYPAGPPPGAYPSPGGYPSPPTQSA